MIQIERSAEATWRGDLKNGQGSTSTETRVLQEAPYSFKTRFENDKQGTNPEELIAAAHAACFSMALSKVLGDQGHPPESISTKANLTLTRSDAGFKISKVHLETEGRVPGVDDSTFRQAAEKAKENCPVSV